MRYDSGLRLRATLQWTDDSVDVHAGVLDSAVAPNADSATRITEFDEWMPRDVWRHPKNRYGY
ncbi:hypothetical protein ACFY9A_00545 [Streptomyces rubradiris]|uniref:hypothetical protein n=1 Tax=Streptomyces rubradiris TaxID=285531 RepID=UPI0033F9F571